MSGLLADSPRKGATASLSRFASMPWSQQRSQTDLPPASRSRAGTPPAFDTQGKLNRKLWLLEQQVKENEEKIEAERSISKGLRDRIGKLEERVRQAEAKARELEEREAHLKKEWEGEMAIKASQHVGLGAQLEDVKDSWRREKAERIRLEGEVERLKAERVSAESDMRAEKLAAVMSPRKALHPQPMNIHVERARTPTTPTKSRICAVKAGESLPPTPKRTPSRSIAQHHAHLEEQHQQLRAEYRKLHARYLEDLKHWKEYKVAETARIDAKKARRAAKKEGKGQGVSSGSTSAEKENVKPGVEGDAKENGGGEGVPSPAKERVPELPDLGLPEVGEMAEPADEQASITAAGQADNTENLPRSLPRSSQMSEEGVYDDDVEVLLPQRRSSQRIRSQRTQKAPSPVKTRQPVAVENIRQDLATPKPPPASRERVATAGRVTPWLGQDSTPMRPVSTSRNKRKAQANPDDDDVFGDDGESSIATPNAATRTPMVRDRGPAPDTSLRLSTLRRTIVKPDNPTEGDMEAGQKRKHADLKAMSPAEKAAELKRLSKMTSKQRREYYAAYKGFGRYLAPEEVRYGVYEDYEIDPAENEGEKFQFHDVKRQRVERKQMHGGDCECCQGYYAAVGHIPRFNQAPKWKDDDKADAAGPSRDAEVRDHQNQVSRHRETWKRPATPPGYWDIGFPGTQAVEAQNKLADEMFKKREEEIQREALHKDSKWRKKKGVQVAPKDVK